MFLKFQNKGFTLAEVLITLLVIGVVASLVIPAIIQDSQDAELKTALKSFYSSISDATRLIMFDNGGSINGLYTSNTVMRDLYANKMSITQKCDENDSPDNCWHPTSGVVKRYDGDYWALTEKFPGIKLTNGTLLLFALTYPNCDGQYSGLISPVSCALIRVDINGFKGPNTFGKDIFDFHILQTTVSPRGGSYDNYHNCSASGDRCAYSVLKNS
jgi:prepilin-type N-terminal cleavage/methylation domain-containing protein